MIIERGNRTKAQQGYIDFLQSYKFNIFLTITYPFDTDEKRIRRDVNLIARHLGKILKMQMVYFGFFVNSETNSHAHILMKTKSMIDEMNLLTVCYNYKDYEFVPRFPFFYIYKIDHLKGHEDLENVSKYLVTKKHMVKEYDYIFENFFHSQTKKLKKSILWENHLN